MTERIWVEIKTARNGYILRFGHSSLIDKDAEYFIEENTTRAGDRVQSYLEALLKKAALPVKPPRKKRDRP